MTDRVTEVACAAPVALATTSHMPPAGDENPSAQHLGAGSGL